MPFRRLATIIRTSKVDVVGANDTSKGFFIKETDGTERGGVTSYNDKIVVFARGDWDVELKTESGTPGYLLPRITLGGGVDRAPIYVSNADVLPVEDNELDFGSSSFRWRNVYAANVVTGDIRLSHGWRICEAEDGLYAEKDGRRYRILLEPVGEQEP